MRRAFTIVEVLVTLVLITGGMLALLLAFSAALGVSRDAEEEQAAAHIANAVMEGLQGTSYESLQDSASPSENVFAGLSGYTITVTTTKPDNPAVLTVAVSRPVRGGTAVVTLTTLAADF